jgi:hypothetical protein
MGRVVAELYVPGDVNVTKLMHEAVRLAGLMLKNKLADPLANEPDSGAVIAPEGQALDDGVPTVRLNGCVGPWPPMIVRSRR